MPSTSLVINILLFDKKQAGYLSAGKRLRGKATRNEQTPELEKNGKKQFSGNIKR
jgi:hypothetical protein